MSFVETRFPDDIAYGSSGGPYYLTDIVTTDSGHERRNAVWSEARSRYNVAHGIRTQAQLDALLAFFRARRGRAYGFRFKDWSDYQASNQLLGIGNGSQTVYQLSKSYVSGTTVHTRTITKPVSGSVTLYLNSVAQSGGFSINTSTGAITFTTAPASGVQVRADFQFDVPVRFDTDALSVSLDAYGMYSALDIPLIEVRV